jgi:hypothetical protein
MEYYKPNNTYLSMAQFSYDHISARQTPRTKDILAWLWGQCAFTKHCLRNSLYSPPNICCWKTLINRNPDQVFATHAGRFDPCEHKMVKRAATKTRKACIEASQLWLELEAQPFVIKVFYWHNISHDSMITLFYCLFIVLKSHCFLFVSLVRTRVWLWFIFRTRGNWSYCYENGRISKTMLIKIWRRICFSN